MTLPELRDIAFIWPSMLWLQAVVPLALLAAWALTRRRRGAGAVHIVGPSLEGGAAAGVAGVAVKPRTRWPAILLLAGIACLLLAVARPKAVVMLPSRTDAIILAVDVSNSMKAADIKPTRLVAAQEAAKAFVDKQPPGVRVGIVSMAATAQLVQVPTDKRDELRTAIDRFETQNGSALGSGIVIALQTLMPDSGIDVQKVIGGPMAQGTTRDMQRQIEALNFKPVPPGSNGSVAIVLMSDGESNVGPELAVATKLAAERGVRIYTVGIGTKQGVVLKVGDFSMRVRLDEEALKKIAVATRADYFRATSAAELTKIYKDVGAKIAMGRGKLTELTAFVAALGAVLCALGALIGIARSGRIV
jgi:Ca-activated chloride channel homolog